MYLQWTHHCDLEDKAFELEEVDRDVTIRMVSEPVVGARWEDNT